MSQTPPLNNQFKLLETRRFLPYLLPNFWGHLMIMFLKMPLLY